MSGDNNTVVMLNLDTKEFADYLREHPSVQKSMDSVMSSNFLGFSPSGSGSYSGYINTLNSWNDTDNHNTILVDKDHRVFLGTGQLQDSRVAQGNDGYPYIVNLGVNQKFRQRGLGGKLLSQLKEKGKRKGYSTVRLNIVEDNGLVQFYRENGFTRVVKPDNTDIPTRDNRWFYEADTESSTDTSTDTSVKKITGGRRKKTGRKCGKRDRSRTGKNKGKLTNSHRTLRKSVRKGVRKRVSRLRH